MLVRKYLVGRVGHGWPGGGVRRGGGGGGAAASLGDDLAHLLQEGRRGRGREGALGGLQRVGHAVHHTPVAGVVEQLVVASGLGRGGSRITQRRCGARCVHLTM